MRRRPRTKMAAMCGLLLHASSLVTPSLANNANLFFDFSTKIRVGSTAASNAPDGGGSGATMDEAAAEAATAAANATFGHSQEAVEVNVSQEVTDALVELEELLAKLIAEMAGEGTMEDDASIIDVEGVNMRTENLLALSVQVPANTTAEDWVSVYGGMISNEQEGYYNAEASGYTI